MIVKKKKQEAIGHPFSLLYQEQPWALLFKGEFLRLPMITEWLSRNPSGPGA